jgi:ATP-binding cassette subfamily B protein
MNVISFILTVIKPHKKYIAIPVLNAIIYAHAVVLIPHCIKNIVNSIQYPEASQHLSFYVILFIAVEATICISWRFADWANLNYEPALRNTISQTIFARLSRHAHRFFQNNFAGSLSAKLGDLVHTIPSMISTMIGGCFLNLITLSIAIVAMAYVSGWLALGLALWAGSFVTLSILTMKRFSYLANLSAQAGSSVMAAVVDAVTNMLSVRLFARSKHEASVIGIAQQTYLTASVRRRWFTLKLNAVQSISFWLYQSSCLLILIWLHAKKQITAGDFAFILTVNLGLVDQLWNLSERIRDFADHWGLASQALATFYQPLEVQDVPGAEALQAPHGAIQFDHVRFSYPGGESLFQNRSIHIPAGQKVGLVGYSGSGKSTFVNLILRLYDITSGRILIDGQDIALITQESLHQAIAVVPQEPTLLHRSIAENIMYGNPTASREEITAAAYKAAAHDFIMSFPEQYDAEVGEGGSMLSGGQRQRIALARALLKNAPILILDEATSQLDTITEKAIQSSLADWFTHHTDRSQTTLVIAHRLSTLLHMDRILVFDKGVIIQDGTHNELIAQEDSLYSMLWRTQVGGFIKE